MTLKQRDGDAVLRNAENQLAQLQELRRQVELQIKQLTNLENILGLITGLNKIASPYNSVRGTDIMAGGSTLLIVVIIIRRTTLTLFS